MGYMREEREIEVVGGEGKGGDKIMMFVFFFFKQKTAYEIGQ